MRRLILLRHGETDWNRDERFQGHSDIALNETGRGQARSGAARLADLLGSAESVTVLSSDLGRARETAEIVVDGVLGQVEILTDPGLREVHGGDWEGLWLSDIAERWPDEHHAWRVECRLDGGAVGGETLRTAGHRMLESIAALAGQEQDTVLVVSHGSSIRAAVGLLTRTEGEDFATVERVGNAHAVVLERESDRSEPAGGEGLLAHGWAVRGYNI